MLFKVTLRDGEVKLPGTLPVVFPPTLKKKLKHTHSVQCIKKTTVFVNLCVCVTSLQRDWLLLYLSVTVCKYSDRCV